MVSHACSIIYLRIQQNSNFLTLQASKIVDKSHKTTSLDAFTRQPRWYTVTLSNQVILHVCSSTGSANVSNNRKNMQNSEFCRTQPHLTQSDVGPDHPPHVPSRVTCLSVHISDTIHLRD